MGVFILEVICSSIGKEDYLFGFFFWLDLISTASLILDVSLVAEALFGGANNDGNAARASRASRAGTRAGRVVRIIRLIRIVKLYKAVTEEAAKQNERKAKAN